MSFASYRDFSIGGKIHLSTTKLCSIILTLGSVDHEGFNLGLESRYIQAGLDDSTSKKSKINLSLLHQPASISTPPMIFITGKVFLRGFVCPQALNTLDGHR